VPVSISIQTLADRLAAESGGLWGGSPTGADRVGRTAGRRRAGVLPGCAVPLLKEGLARVGVQFLYTLLTGVLLPFAIPRWPRWKTMWAIARALMEKEPLLDVKLARRISNSMALGNQPLGKRRDPPPSWRCSQLSPMEAGFCPCLFRYCGNQDPRLRSKAALLVGLRNQ